MLKNIPRSFTPDLIKLMMEMGHGEELLIADANYPALTTGGNIPRLYITGHKISELLADILRFFPLDEMADFPAVVMEAAKESEVYDIYSDLLKTAGSKGKIETAERFDFYKRAANVTGIVITSDTVKAGNILIKKGVVREF